MAPGAVVGVENLGRSYGDLRAVDGVSFSVMAGEVFGILGPNGAGKTTTVEILEGFRDRDTGRVEVLGHDPARGERQLRERVGIVLQQCGLDPFLKVSEYLKYTASAYPHPRPVDEVLGLIGLEEKAGERVKTLSGGQQRRLDLGLAIVGDPELIFLDEPTTGFDPSARRGAWELVKGLCRLGKTVVLTTHFMDEAQYLADRVIVMRAGHVVAEGPPEVIGGRATAATRITFTLGAGVPLGDVPVEVEVLDRVERRMVLMTNDPTRTLHTLTGWALERGVVLDGLEVARPSLEDVYLALTDGASAERVDVPDDHRR